MMPSLNWNSFEFLGREGLDPGSGENEMAKPELNQSQREKVDVCVCILTLLVVPYFYQEVALGRLPYSQYNRAISEV